MEIKIERSELLRGLETAGRFVSRKPVNEILGNIYLNATSTQLELSGTDLSAFCQTIINDLEVIKEGEVLLPFRVVYEVIKKIPIGEEVLIKRSDSKICIKAKNFEFNCTITEGLDNSIFMGPQIPETPVATIAGKDLIENINNVKDSAATDNSISRPILLSVLIERKNNELNFVALDGFRISWAQVSQEGKDFSAAVNAKTVADICKILDPEKETQIYATDNIVIFKQDNVVCKAPINAGAFIDYIAVFNETPSEIKIEVLKEDIIAAIERANVIASEDKNNIVKLEVTDSELKISSTTQNAVLNDKVLIDKKGGNYKIAFNALFLIDALKNHNEKIVIYSTGTNTAPWNINSEDNTLKTFVLPVKLREVEEIEEKAS